MTENTRNIGFAGESEEGTDQAVRFARSLAVVVGINNYADPIPALKTPGNDARRIKEVLEGQQQFEVLPPLTEDVTRSRLLELFTATLPGLNLGPSDRLLVYFAGHGTEMSGAGGEPEYYLVPQDARPDDRDSFLPMRLVRDELLKLQCRHLLLVLDCCFAGGFGRMRSFDDLPPKIYRQRFDFYVSSPAWQVIASAAHDETALDTAGGYVFGRRAIGAETEHSPFASALFDALEGQADVNPASQEGEPAGDGLITAAELYVWIRDRVQAVAGTTHRQSPGLWPLPNHEAGEFVFRNPERALSLEDALPLTAGANPYRGLNSYDEAQSHLFFGRAKQIAALSEKVAAEPFVAVLGVSGTGKSSLAKAGLIPTLGGSHRVGDPPEPRQVGETRWLTLPPFRPTAEPVASLTRLLTDHLPTYMQQVPTPASDATALAALVSAWRADHPGARLALVIDQFEELVTLCADKAQRQHFQALLANALAAPDDALRVIITLRTDFEPQYNQGVLQPFWGNQARYVVLPMSQDELRQVILGPAWASEIYFESRALVDALINEVVQAPGGLPLLSFALSEMYLRYIASGRQDRTLRQADFDAVGGVIGSLRAAANAIWDGLDPAHQATMERLMLRMIAIGGGEVARRRVAWAELDYGEPENTRRDAVIGQLEEARLVVPDEDAGWVEPAHDALVSGWDRLTEWKFKAASYLPLQRDLAPAALLWQADGVKPSLLWDDDPRLPQVEETLWPTDGEGKGLAGRIRWARQVLAPQTKTPTDTKWLNRPELSFTQASVSRRASTFRRIIGITAAVMIVLAGLALFASYQANQATQQRNEANIQRDNAVKAGATAVAEGNARATEAVVRTTAEANAVQAQQTAAAEADARATQVVMRTTAEADARQKQAEAEKAARRAQAGELAVHAENAIVNNKNDPSLALLLAIQAVTLTWRAEEQTVTIDADRALRDAVDAAPPYRMMLSRNHYGRLVYSAVYGPDGKTFVTANDDSTARVWDAATGKMLHTLNGHTKSVLSASYSPDSKQIVTASLDQTARIWDAATGQAVHILIGHGCDSYGNCGVSSAVYSPDGRHVVTASYDNTARIWDAATGQELRPLRGHDVWLSSATYSPNGQFIVTTSGDGTARIWDATTGQAVRTLTGHTAPVLSAAYSPDGQSIVTASRDNTARIWDAATGNEARQLRGHSDKVYSAAYSPNGKFIVTASQDNTARIWDAATGNEVRQLTGYAVLTLSAAYSPDGQTIITAGNHAVRIWDASTGQEIPPLNGHSQSVNSAVYSPGGRNILTASYDGTAIIWDAMTGKALLQLRGHTNGVMSAGYSPDGKFIVTASLDGSARIWDAPTGQEVRKLNSHVKRVMSAGYGPDGKTIVTASLDGGARIWDAATGREVRQLRGHSDSVSSAVYSPDGKTIVTAGCDQTDNSGSCIASTARIWDAATGREVRQLRGHSDSVSSAVYSLDGKTIVTASDDNTARVWDAATGQELRQLRGHTSDVYSAAYSPDGRTIITASGDQTARIWDAETGQELRQLNGNDGIVTSAAYSPDGQFIVTALSSNTARIWDAVAGKEQRQLTSPSGPFYSAAYSPDGKTIVTANEDRAARIWNAKTGQELRRLGGHGCDDYGAGLCYVRSARYSPDGRTIVTIGSDESVRIWDATTGAELHQISFHPSTVNSARYSPDSQTIVTASNDGSARVWDVATGQELRRLSSNTGALYSAACSPDGKAIVTTGADGTTRIWNAVTGEPLRRIFEGFFLTYSPNGQFIVTTAAQTARIWNVATGEEVRQLRSQSAGFGSAAYSPDGGFIVSANADGMTRIYDVATAQIVRILSGHGCDGAGNCDVTSAVYSPDGKTIVTAGKDGTARIWIASINDLLDVAARLIQRDPPLLTSEERRKYGLE